MLGVIIWAAVFIASFFVLIKSSHYFIDAIRELSISLKVSPFVIGATVVAMGTSLPELTSAIFSVIRNSSEIVIGNVIGANIANIFLGLGVSALFATGVLKIRERTMDLGMLMLVCSSIILTVTIIDGVFTIYEALLFIALFAVYIFSTRKMNNLPTGSDKEVKLKYRSVVTAIISLAFIYVGSKYVVESIITLSALLGIGKEILASTVVSIGTTLPELMVGITAIRKKEVGIAMGNILGSNVFNILGVMGIAGLFGEILIPSTIISFALPVMLASTLVFFIMFQDNKLNKIEAALLVLMYLLFLLHSLGFL